MGWFDEQIRIRKEQDNAAFEEAFLNIARAVIGEKLTKTLKEGGRATGDAICEILRYYNISYDFMGNKLRNVYKGKYNITSGVLYVVGCKDLRVH